MPLQLIASKLTFHVGLSICKGSFSTKPRWKVSMPWNRSCYTCLRIFWQSLLLLIPRLLQKLPSKWFPCLSLLSIMQSYLAKEWLLCNNLPPEYASEYFPIFIEFEFLQESEDAAHLQALAVATAFEFVTVLVRSLSYIPSSDVPPFVEWLGCAEIFLEWVRVHPEYLSRCSAAAQSGLWDAIALLLNATRSIFELLFPCIFFYFRHKYLKHLNQAQCPHWRQKQSLGDSRLCTTT